MDFEEKRKRQKIRVIIAEIGMVMAVAAIVVVSTLAAMGFVISGNGSIEQSGLMQLHTLPTGANVKIDGAAVFGRTNLSRTLSAGEHSLEIYRDGYDSWQNKIKVRPGVLVRLYYPRLFLLSRTSEMVKNLAKSGALDFYLASPKRNYIVYAEQAATQWKMLEIRGDEVRETVLDMTKVLPGMVEEKTTRKIQATTDEKKIKFEGKIEEVRWSDNEENLLVKVAYEGKSEWVLVRLRDMTRSANLSKTFGLGNDARLEFIDGAANELYVLEKRQLRRINTTNNIMSRILVENVVDFMNDEMKVVYLSDSGDGKERKISVFRDDDKAGTELTEVADGVKVSVALSNYYDDDYVIWTEDNKVTVLYGRLPSYDENGANIGSLKTLVEGVELKETPERVEVSYGGEYWLATKANQFMAIDVDDGELYEYKALTDKARWFDDSMLYGVVDNQIVVWDFDGKNQRNLSENVKTKSDAALRIDDNSPVTVASNNKYIYYLTSTNNNVYLSREQIRD